MNNPIVINHIPFKIDTDKLKHNMRINSSSMENAIEELISQANKIANPKGMYNLSYIENRGDDYTVIEGIKFNSKILKINLEKVERIFPCLVTCGPEIEEWSKTITTPLHSFWADAIGQMILESSTNIIREHMNKKFKTGKTSFMSPGSLEDWPITEQKKLFQLFGDTKELIGVELNDNYIMTPLKSVSGVNFSTEISFESCQLCPKDRCPTRRTPYDKTLLEKKYR